MIMSILDSYIEETFINSELQEDKYLSRDSFDYEYVDSEEINNINSENFGFNYGKDYYKCIERSNEEKNREKSREVNKKNEEEQKDSYKLIGYGEGIYTDLVEVSNEKGIIKYTKKASCKAVIYNTKVINVNLPDNGKEKKCIVRGVFMFNLEYYIGDDRNNIYESKISLPFSKIIIIPIDTPIGIKISVKIEDYYLNVLSSNSVMLSATALVLVYDKKSAKIV